LQIVIIQKDPDIMAEAEGRKMFQKVSNRNAGFTLLGGLTGVVKEGQRPSGNNRFYLQEVSKNETYRSPLSGWDVDVYCCGVQGETDRTSSAG